MILFVDSEPERRLYVFVNVVSIHCILLYIGAYIWHVNNMAFELPNDVGVHGQL